MSSDTNPDVPPHIRCEAISSSTAHNLACHRAHGSVLRYPGTDRTGTPGDDPAVLIGLAFGYVRQGDGLTGIVPEMIIDHLRSHADTSNLACRLVLDWLGRRNDDLLASSLEPAMLPPTKSRTGRRKICERRQSEPGSLKKRRPKMTRPSDSSLAIIAADTEGHIDA